jgi:hypothetical protein
MRNALLFLCFVLVLNLSAVVIGIPDDYPTIGEGINSATDGDTILVQPGVYEENIDFEGKNITIGSLFLTTQDTTYISQTIIDGGQNGSVVTFATGETSSAVLTGFTLTNGSGSYILSGTGPSYKGGGIICVNANPTLSYLYIDSNSAADYGGGLFFANAEVNMSHLKITDNSSYNGGGIYASDDSNLFIVNCEINDNESANHGGGIHLNASDAMLDSVVLNGNIAHSGGALYSSESYVDLGNSIMSANEVTGSGGAIFILESGIYLSESSMFNNTAAIEGGGIYHSSGGLSFDSENRSSIYCNSAFVGNDLYNEVYYQPIDVVVDTFTVMEPGYFQAYPIYGFSFDIVQGKIEHVAEDLYVSPDGDNSNSGLSFDEPLQNIGYALSIISATADNPRTIYLDEGVYSPQAIGESFPIQTRSWVSIVGMDEETTILDAEMTGVVIKSSAVEGINIENLTMTNGNANGGGGFQSSDSSVEISNVTITMCAASFGGGMWLSYSDIVMNNVSVVENEAKHYGGIRSGETNLAIYDSDISSNFSNEIGGGVYLWGGNLIIESSTVTDNIGTGIRLAYPNVEMYDVSISNNTNRGIYCYHTDLYLENVSITNYTSYSGGAGLYCVSNSTVTFSETNRSSIYQNSATYAQDIYSEVELDVVLDTFTVMVPTSYYAAPLSNLSFDIQHGMQEQIDADLYVSPEGDNNNSGLSWDYPLQTIDHAMSKILTTSSNPRTIYLSEGTYGPQTSDDEFPIYSMDHLRIVGAGMENTNIDGESDWIPAFIFAGTYDAEISHLTIHDSGGIKCDKSSPLISELKLVNNNNYGIYCENNSSPIIQNSVLVNNQGGIRSIENSSPVIINSTIAYNNYSARSANPGLSIEMNSHPIVVNSIFWHNLTHEIRLLSFPGIGDSVSVTIAYSDIKNGENGIHSFYGAVNWLDGNIAEDPLFIDAPDNLYLHEDSPCIDAGTSYFEWEGNVIVDLSPDQYYGSAPDMGALEWEGVFADDPLTLPLVNKLQPNYPNPFNPETTIKFSIRNDAKVEISIYNIKGQRVKNLVQQEMEKGEHQIVWNGKNEEGQTVSSGVYFYKLMVDGKAEDMRKCLLLK